MPDASVGEPDSGSIGTTLDGGLGLVFVIKRGLPSEHDRNGYRFNFDSAKMTLMNLRLVADSVADGDERTTMELVQGAWSGELVEVPALYPDAPPGLYSRIRGTVAAFELEGEVQLSDMNFYELEVDAEGINVPFESTVDYNLEVGAPLLLKVEVDLRKVMDEVEFDDLPVMDGEISIGDGSSQAMDKIEDKLAEAFNVVGVL